MMGQLTFPGSWQRGIPRALASPRKREIDNRGVALVITLLLLFLMSVLGLAAVLATSSDLLINGFYANYRSSFYASDSGLNVARQTIANDLNPGTLPWNPAWTCVSGTASQGPISAGTMANVQTQVMTAYGNSNPLTRTPNTGAGASSLSESFKILPPANGVAMITQPATSPSVTCPAGSPTAFQYTYNYTLTSLGSATGSEQSTITENGDIIINVSITQPTFSPSFAYFGAYVQNYPPCLGPLVPGTMTGPMFTNGEWGFMPGGSYIFTDPVGQQNATASYFDSNWNCYQSGNASFTAPNGQVIAPQFQQGFQVGQPPIPPPPNDFSQKWAALDGMGCGENNGNSCANPASPPVNAPTAAQMSADLKDINGNAYAAGATGGVYLNYQTVNGVPSIGCSSCGGGLYVEGNANVVLSTSGASGQVITVTQGTPPTTTTITIDPVAGKTTVASAGNPTLVLAGVPQNKAVNPPQNGTMLYVDGTITSLSGTGEGVPAIQDGASLTVTALGDVDITGDVVYKTEPVTTTQNQIPGAPVDTLIPGNDKNQDLGIFTTNGNIVLSTTYADDNLEVDGSQAAIGSNCAGNSCGFTVNGCINTFNNVGGQIQTNIFGACMNTENTYYDRRYNTRSGFAPPWFPGTTITQNGTPVTQTLPPQIQRTQWVSSMGQ